jgi:hypothetical protein
VTDVKYNLNGSVRKKPGRVPVLAPPGKKWCGVCRSFPDIGEFAIARGRSDGRHFRCKSCDSKVNKDKRLAAKGVEPAVAAACPEPESSKPESSKPEPAAKAKTTFPKKSVSIMPPAKPYLPNTPSPKQQTTNPAPVMVDVRRAMQNLSSTGHTSVINSSGFGKQVLSGQESPVCVRRGGFFLVKIDGMKAPVIRPYPDLYERDTLVEEWRYADGTWEQVHVDV